MDRKLKTKLAISAVLLSIIAWSALIYFVGSEEIVDFIGVKNGYFVIFFIALFGGMSSFTGVSYPAAIITLASGGLEPLLLALASAAGIIIGDSIYFYLSHRGSHLLEEGKIKTTIDRFSRWLNRQSRVLVAVVVYLYTAFTPFPNDLLTISLGLARQPYLVVITALALGNLTFTYLLAQFGQVLAL